MWQCRSRLIAMAKRSGVFLVHFLCVNRFLFFHSHDNPTIMSVSQLRKQRLRESVSPRHIAAQWLLVSLWGAPRVVRDMIFTR